MLPAGIFIVFLSKKGNFGFSFREEKKEKEKEMLQDAMAKFLVLITALFMLFGTGSLFFNAFQFLRLGVDASKEKKMQILQWMAISVGVMIFVFLVSYFFNDFLFNEILLKGKGTTLLQAAGDLWKVFTESIPTPKQ